MHITTIQIYEDTKKMLDQIKQYPRESYDSVLKRAFQSMLHKHLPSPEEMFQKGDMLQQKKVSTGKIIGLSHALRGKR